MMIQVDPTVSDRSRLIAALAYIPTCCFLPYFLAHEDRFARAHGRQACLVLIGTVVLGLLVRVLDWAFGPVPILGVILQVLARLTFGLSVVLVSALGAVRALTGEPVTHRLLARYADHLRV